MPKALVIAACLQCAKGMCAAPILCPVQWQPSTIRSTAPVETAAPIRERDLWPTPAFSFANWGP